MRVDLLDLAVTGAFVEILAALRAQSFARLGAERLDRESQDAFLADDGCEVDNPFFGDRAGLSRIDLALTRKLLWDEQLGDLDIVGEGEGCQAADALHERFGVEHTLDQHTLGCSGETQGAIEVGDQEVIGFDGPWLLEGDLTAVTGALLQQEPDVQPEDSIV